MNCVGPASELSGPESSAGQCGTGRTIPVKSNCAPPWAGLAAESEHTLFDRAPAAWDLIPRTAVLEYLLFHRWESLDHV